MTMGLKLRQYDFALLGATGFTAAYVAQIFVTKFPKQTRWLIAGRDPSKLARLRNNLSQLNPKGPLPGMSFLLPRNCTR